MTETDTETEEASGTEEAPEASVDAEHVETIETVEHVDVTMLEEVAPAEEAAEPAPVEAAAVPEAVDAKPASEAKPVKEAKADKAAKSGRAGKNVKGDLSADAMREMIAAETRGATYNVSLPASAFEGPLDLLLHLCQKHELDILDIPISFVTEKYLEYLAVMTLADLDIASEYLLMAATLAHIKSKMLLPQEPAGQEDDAFVEEEDPREALIKRLLEYQKYKQAAADLLSRGIAGNDVFPRGAKIEEAVHTGMPPLADVPLFALCDAFQAVLSRTKVKLTHDIVADRISLADRILEMNTLIIEKGRIEFSQLFTGLTNKFDIVITFLALLEMTKLRMTRIMQTEPMAPIYIEASGEIVEGIDEQLPGAS